MSVAKFPNTLSDTNNYYGISVPWINSEAARLNVNSTRLGELNDLYDEPAAGTGWLQIYPLTMDDTTVTPSLRDTRKDLIVAVNDKLREIYLNLPEADLTQTDRNKLRIFKRKPRSIRTRINEAPDVALTTMEGGNIRQRLRFDTDENRASRHPDADGWIRVSKTVGAPPSSPEDCPVKEEGTRVLSTIEAGSVNDRQPYYCFVRWAIFGQSAKNGPWSGMEVVSISAGTVGTE